MQMNFRGHSCSTVGDQHPVGKKSQGSYEIAQVAIGLRDYKGHKADLVRTKRNVLFYEERMERGEFPEALCLLRVSSNGRITLFETNQRAVALYLFYFVDKKAPYTPIEGILGETKAKLLFQSQ